VPALSVSKYFNRYFNRYVDFNRGIQPHFNRFNRDIMLYASW
jgi:hypothetical protein